MLYSLQGYQYCDLLLTERESAGVLQRAHKTIEWVSDFRVSFRDVALDHLSLARAHLATDSPDFEAAETHVRDAVDGLRTYGNADDLPRGLLARAAFHRMRDDLPSAWKDLDAVATLVRRHELRLFDADHALEATRCHLAAGDKPAARTTLAKARKLVNEMSYGRRIPELNDLAKQLDEDGPARADAVS